MRRLLVGLLSLLLTACGEDVQIAGTRDLSLRVAAGAREVQSGAPFPLTVVRTWKKPLVPKDVDPSRFAPLVLTLESSTRREDAARIEETLQYRAYAFARSDVVVPAQRLAAEPPGGGVERVVSAPAFRLRVSPAIDEQQPGPPEMPGPPLMPERAPAWPYGLGALLLLAFLLLARLWGRWGPAPVSVVVPPPPPAPPADQALAALDALQLRVAAGATPDEHVLFDVAQVLRRYVGGRARTPVVAKTASEVLGVAMGLFPASGQISPLEKTLAAEELAKFAKQPASPKHVAALLDDAVQFVRETRPSTGGTHE